MCYIWHIDIKYINKHVVEVMERNMIIDKWLLNKIETMAELKAAGVEDRFIFIRVLEDFWMDEFMVTGVDFSTYINQRAKNCNFKCKIIDEDEFDEKMEEYCKYIENMSDEERLEYHEQVEIEIKNYIKMFKEL